MLNKPSTRSFLAFLLFGIVVTVAAQQPVQPPVTQIANAFVQDVLSRAGSPSTVAISFQNLSQLSADAQQAAQNAIVASLRGAGVRVVKPEMAVAEVKVVFSEDWQNYLWIAEIHQG